jgi:Cu2+-exporting ATPase
MECFHCGEAIAGPAARRASVLGEERAFCCAGCEAVALTIAGAGLESYYRTRTQPAVRPDDEAARPPDALPEGKTEAALVLERVRCSACLWLIEETLRRLPGVKRAQVNYATRRAHVAWEPGSAALAGVIRAIRSVGYDAHPYDPRREAEMEKRERRTALWRLFVAAFGAMQVMMYAFPAYVEDGPLPPDTQALMRWASLLITAPVVLFACRPFFEGAWHELRAMRLGLETPIALGIGGGFLASAWATLAGSGEVYFDSISMLAFLLLAARYAESAVRRRARAELDPLLKFAEERSFSPDQLVSIAPGERIPADGIVEEGVSSADESLLTGESRPVAKRAGDELVAGSVNLEQPLVMRVTRAGADTRAAAIARLVERAAASRPPLVEAADRVGRSLTLAVLAAAAFFYWRSGDGWIAIAILVATCPCAIALASPIVLTRAGAALLGRGVLLTRARALAPLARVTDIVLDKTGTLTEGRWSVAQIFCFQGTRLDECRRLAAALESASLHPVARGLRLADAPAASGVTNHPGLGLEGFVDGVRLRLGSVRFCAGIAGRPPEEGSHPKGGATRVYLAAPGRWLAAFDLEDAPRPGAQAVVARLQDGGLIVHLCSGDSPDVVAETAYRLGIGNFRALMRPQDKLAYVRDLQRRGRVVAMVGDGLNDMPVLAGADASIAMAGGADAAQLQADAVLLGRSLEGIPALLDAARRSMRLVRENLAWALAYNALALPLAAAGLLGPWQAALAMGASSVAVLLNALRPVVPPDPWKASSFSFRSPSPSYS